MTDLYAPVSETPADDEDKDYLAEYVGEGKPFKDERALAKGKAHSDAFIKQLQGELAGLRKELDSRLQLEEFLQEVKKTPPSQVPTPTPVVSNQGTNQGERTEVKAEDIRNLVSETLLMERTKQTQDSNLNFVRQELTKAYGNDFGNKLDQVAKELGLTKEYMTTMASNSPQAFLKLVGTPAAPSRGPADVAPPRSTVSAPSHAAVDKDRERFEKLRKENPREYWSPRVQSEIHRLSLERGKSIY